MHGTSEVSTVTPVNNGDAKSAASVHEVTSIVLVLSHIETLKHTHTRQIRKLFTGQVILEKDVDCYFLIAKMFYALFFWGEIKICYLFILNSLECT